VLSRRLQPILDRLANGETIEGFKGSGNSMTPLIKHRQPRTLSPVDVEKLENGDIVFVRVRGSTYCHLVKAIKPDKVLICNNHGHVNGWTSKRNVFAIVTQVGDRQIPSAKKKILTKKGD